MSTQPIAAAVGPLLRAWRTSRGISQLALSLEAGISTRHLSYVETGRSNPSREMVLTIAEHLDVPLRDRNALLEAAGFAAVYSETPLDAPAMDDMRDALSRILAATEPNPTLVVNRRYDVLQTNDAALRLLSFFAPAWRGKNNVALMLFSPDGLRSAIHNWDEVAIHIVHRLRTELGASRARDARDEEIIAHADAAARQLRRGATTTRPPAILIPVKLRRGSMALDLFTTITTLGTPLDITLQELRIETLFPASPRDREVLAEITGN